MHKILCLAIFLASSLTAADNHREAEVFFKGIWRNYLGAKAIIQRRKAGQKPERRLPPLSPWRLTTGCMRIATSFIACAGFMPGAQAYRAAPVFTGVSG